MNTKTKEVYYCDHCKKHGLSKHSMIKHEDVCIRNPLNYHPCFQCVHFEIKTETTNSGEVKYAFCDKKNTPLRNRIAEVKGWVEQYPESYVDSELMPKECSLFSAKYPIIDRFY